jgi:hypothetical protein
MKQINKNPFTEFYEQLLLVQLVRKLALLWNLQFYWRVCKWSPAVPNLNQMNQVFDLPSYFKILLLPVLWIQLPASLFTSIFQRKIWRIISSLYSPTRAMLHNLHTSPSSKLCWRYLLWDYSIWTNFVCTNTHILLSNLFPSTLNPCSLMNMLFSHKTTQNIIILFSTNYVLRYVTGKKRFCVKCY